MRGEIADYEESLRRRVGMLAGIEPPCLTASTTTSCGSTTALSDWSRNARRAGLSTLLVTGGFTTSPNGSSSAGLGLRAARMNLR